MGYTIALRLDDATAKRLTDMVPEAPSWLPFLVFDSEIAIRAIHRTLLRLARAWEPISVTLGTLGVHPSVVPNTSLLPIPTAELLSRHRRLYAALAVFPCVSTFLPDQWMPGIILPISLDDTMRIVLPSLSTPLVGSLVAIDVLEHSFIGPIQSYPLRHRQSGL